MTIPGRPLTKHSLYRVVYTLIPDGEGHRTGGRKTVVADSIQEAIDRVLEHERTQCEWPKVEISEVVRESIEVWS